MTVLHKEMCVKETNWRFIQNLTVLCTLSESGKNKRYQDIKKKKKCIQNPRMVAKLRLVVGILRNAFFVLFFVSVLI